MARQELTLRHTALVSAGVPQRAIDLFSQNELAFNHFDPSTLVIKTGMRKGC